MLKRIRRSGTHRPRQRRGAARLLLAALVLLAALTSSCSEVDSEQCMPGASVGCVGANGCAGFQVCAQDGSRFEACDCSGVSAATSTASTSSTSGGGSGGTGTASSTVAGSGGGGAGGGAPWSPLDLPGLALWLDPDVGVVEDPQHPGTVLGWQDQSGNGSIASAQNVQDGFRFDIDPIAFNGHIAIRCPGNGTSLNVPDSPAFHWGTGDFAIAMVVKVDSGQTTTSVLWLKNSSQGNLVRFEFNIADAFEFGIGSDSVVVGLQNPQSFHIAVMRGQALRLQVDAGSASGPSLSADVDNTGTPVVLCHAGANQTATEIAEVVAAAGPVSDAEVGQLVGYFKQKFGL